MRGAEGRGVNGSGLLGLGREYRRRVVICGLNLDVIPHAGT